MSTARVIRRTRTVLRRLAAAAFGVAYLFAPSALAAQSPPAASSPGAAPAAVATPSPLPETPGGAQRHLDQRKPEVAGAMSSTNLIIAPSASKPKAVARTLRGIGLDLNTSAHSLWPTRPTSLTATTNIDVGPTPYYIEIYDQDDNSRVGACGTGTSCTVSVTQDYPGQHRYRAYIARWSTTTPSQGVVAMSATIPITWNLLQVRMVASPSTVVPGAQVILTSETYEVAKASDIGPTPFYNYLIDENTGQILSRCANGTTCTAATSQQVLTTHRFSAFVAGYTAALPLPTIQFRAAPSFVTWTTSSYRLELSVDPNAYRLTATSSLNIAPYFIQIYELKPGNPSARLLGLTRLAICRSGTTCTAALNTTVGEHSYVAFIASSDEAMPPPQVQANSTTAWVPFFSL